MFSRRRIGCLPVLVLATLASAAHAEDWERMTASQFPAHVKSITFRRYTIDATRWVRWGKWEVAFGAASPIARWSVPSNGTGDEVGMQVTGLKCTNDVVGTVDCWLWLIHDPHHGYVCEFMGDQDLEKLDPDCPTDLTLE